MVAEDGIVIRAELDTGEIERLLSETIEAVGALRRETRAIASRVDRLEEIAVMDLGDMMSDFGRGSTDIERIRDELADKALNRMAAGATIAKTGAEPDRDTEQEIRQ